MVRDQLLKKLRDDNKEVLGDPMDHENSKNVPPLHAIQKKLGYPKGEYKKTQFRLPNREITHYII